MKRVWFNKYELKYQWEKISVKLMIRLADMVPKRLAYWVLIRVGGRHMKNDVVPDVPYTVILERFYKEIHG